MDRIITSQYLRRMIILNLMVILFQPQRLFMLSKEHPIILPTPHPIMEEVTVGGAVVVVLIKVPNPKNNIKY